MKQFILSFTICLLFVLKANAQDDFAVIRDSDGFTNIHESTLQSKTTGKILKYQPFDCYTDEDLAGSDYPNMIAVGYSEYANKNGESYQCNARSQNNNNVKTGYIYKNRVYKLSQMPQIKLKTVSDSKALFVNDSIQITFETAKFNPSKHQLKDDNRKLITDTNLDALSEKLSYVDGKRIWGYISEHDSKEITSITINYKNKKYSLPAGSFKNIFAPNFEDNYTKICVGLDGELYIWMQNGDGAAGYNVIWVIAEGELKYMYLDISLYA